MSERTDNIFLFKYLIPISLWNDDIVIMLLLCQVALGSLLKSTSNVIIARQMKQCICFQLEMTVMYIDLGIIGNGKVLKLCYPKGKKNHLTFLELCSSASLLLNNEIYDFGHS